VDISPLAEEERLRTEFVTSAAHEFRNPLTVIRGYAEIAKRDPQVQGSSVAHELDRILDAATRVETLADGLLRAAELHLPATVLRREVVDLARLSESTVHEFNETEAHDGHPFAVTAKPATVLGDPALLREAIVNLLRQAVAVTPSDKAIEVTVSTWDGIATLAVTDHGSEVPARELESLFAPFVLTVAPAGNAQARPVLLLYLARRIIEESGGWMRARSSPRGTTVSFTLPRYQGPEEEQENPTENGALDSGVLRTAMLPSGDSPSEETRS
jgi:two-component system OmpR family sensor kinase